MTRSRTLPLDNTFTAPRSGCPIHVRSDGPADRPAVVFTHGFTMDHRVFDAQAALLSERFHVIRWDVPGHGRSRPLATSFTLSRAADDLLSILDALHVERATFVGHSMGGLVAQEIEFRHPERVQGLAMISSTCLTFRQPGIVRLGDPLTSAALRVWPDRWTRTQIGWIAGTRPGTRAYATGAASMMTKADRLAVWRGLLNGFHEEPGYRIRCPLLLIEGQWDWIVAAGLIRLLARRWIDRDRPWRHVVVPRAGHNAHQDNPTVVNRELTAFLRHVHG